MSIACYSFVTVSLPPMIEIVPPNLRTNVEIFVPGSKSITNRCFILGALSSTSTVLRGALWSEDTQIMASCLGRLGISLRFENDPDEDANRTVIIQGGEICPGGTPEAPLDLYVGNAGTAARFLAALVCLGKGSYRLAGNERMNARPQGGLFSALRELGYRIDSLNNRLPAVIHGTGPRPGAKSRVRIQQSSQFASALLLAAPRGGWEVAVEGEDAEESPHVQMTAELTRSFPAGGTFQVEPDASSASYFWGAGWLLKDSRIVVANWTNSSLQIDARFPDVLRTFPSSISRRSDLGDAVMTAIVLSPFADAPKTFTDLGRLRVQECERVHALRTELTKCGARVIENADTLQVFPGPLHGTEIETYDDHRIAMCFAMLGLSVPGMRIRNPDCVNKTFPTFFQKLAQLGATVRPA